MNCPYCDREMESGFLQSHGALVWNPEERVWLFPDRKKGGIYVMTHFHDEPAPSFHCRDCEVLITPLRDLPATTKRAGKTSKEPRA